MPLAYCLRAMEAKWVTSTQGTGRGVTRSRADLGADPLPLWMTPREGHRLHWSDRQQQLQEQQQQPQPTQLSACPADQARADDMLDVLQACGSHPLESRWSNLWQSVHAALFFLFFCCCWLQGRCSSSSSSRYRRLRTKPNVRRNNGLTRI